MVLSTYDRHFEIPKSLPEVFECIRSDEGSGEEADPFYATHTADGETGHA